MSWVCLQKLIRIGAKRQSASSVELFEAKQHKRRRAYIKKLD